MNSSSSNLRERAERAARDAGFETQFSSDVQAQLQHIETTPESTTKARDLRDKLWSSIDNDDSRDLDQVEWCEALSENRIRVCVGIADVASQVLAGTPIDEHAAHNTTSLYTGIEVFPMLPEKLSTDLTSLSYDEERLAFVTEMTIDENGEVLGSDLYHARVFNRAKLAYESIGDWLDGGNVPNEVAQVEGLQAQLELQWQAAQRLQKHRLGQGALDVELPEARPVVKDGQVTDMQVPRKNAARVIIESFMVTANMVLAQQLEAAHRAMIQRVVREPQRWPRLVDLAREHGTELPSAPDARALSQFVSAQREKAPAQFGELSLAVLKLLGRGEYVMVRGPEDSVGHFGLGLQDYAHSTAPNRRFPDLVTQRIVLAYLNDDKAPYDVDELTQIAAHCTEREAAAQKVERLMRKVAAATLVQNRIGDEFDAVVTGASSKGVYVRTVAPAIEGRVMQGERGLDVGDRVKVKLQNVNMERGFIDFERA